MGGGGRQEEGGGGRRGGQRMGGGEEVREERERRGGKKGRRRKEGGREGEMTRKEQEVKNLKRKMIVSSLADYDFPSIILDNDWDFTGGTNP